MWDLSIQTNNVIEVRRLNLVVVNKKRRTCKAMILQFLEIVVLKRRREDRKLSRIKKGVIEDLECKSEDYTISCGLFRCYI